jgi:probable rRNA maturation factor
MAVWLIVNGGPYPGVSRGAVVRWARAMLRAVQMPRAELSILLTDDAQMKRLNGIYRGKDRPTDVMAFAQREGEQGERAGRLLGDVVVSIPTAHRQAAARGAEISEELTMLLAHGLLHLVGWDHQTANADRRMGREVKRLCDVAAATAPRLKRRMGDDSKGGPTTRKSGRRTR